MLNQMKIEIEWGCVLRYVTDVNRLHVHTRDNFWPLSTGREKMELKYICFVPKGRKKMRIFISSCQSDTSVAVATICYPLWRFDPIPLRGVSTAVTRAISRH